MKPFASTHVPYIYGLFTIAVLMSIDYMLRPTHYASPLIETIIPWHYWGMAMFLFGTVGILAMRYRLILLVIHMHIAFVGIYVTLGTGYITSCFQRQEYWGWAPAIPSYFIALGHLIHIVLHTWQRDNA